MMKAAPPPQTVTYSDYIYEISWTCTFRFVSIFKTC